MQASSTGLKVNVRGILLSLAMNAALPVALYLLSKRSLLFRSGCSQFRGSGSGDRQQDLARDAACLSDARVCQRIMHFRSDPFGAHNPALAQQGEMLADFGLALACYLHQLLDRLPGLSKQVELLETRRIRQCLAQLGLPAKASVRMGAHFLAKVF